MVTISLGWASSAADIGTDMRDHFVIDPLIGKRQQLLLATQLCRMVLKVCDPVSAHHMMNLDRS